MMMRRQVLVSEVLGLLVSKLLALDQATRTSGYAIFDSGKLIDYGTFTFTDEDIGERLVKIRNKILSLIEIHNINEVAFEDIQLQNNQINNVDTFQKLAEVFGVVQELCTEINMPYQIVSASSWKSTCKIKGAVRDIQKKNAQLYIQEKYNLKVAQDACDAICLGEHAAKHTSQVYNWD